MQVVPGCVFLTFRSSCLMPGEALLSGLGSAKSTGNHGELNDFSTGVQQRGRGGIGCPAGREHIVNEQNLSALDRSSPSPGHHKRIFLLRAAFGCGTRGLTRC